MLRKPRIAQHHAAVAEMSDTMPKLPIVQALRAVFCVVAVGGSGLLSSGCLVDNPRIGESVGQTYGDEDECVVDEHCLGGDLCEFGLCVPPEVGPICGDGVVDVGEDCDFGPDNEDQGECKSDCTLQACGDGFTGPDEECDDGNGADGDACTNACTVAVCGDAVVALGVEECDDGNVDEQDDCRTDCRLTASATCGDDVQQPGEFCFSESTILSTTQPPIGLAVGDFDDDGMDDVVVGLRVITGARVFLSKGDGGFEPQDGVGFNDGIQEGGVGVSAAIVSVDFDADGRMDVMGGTRSAPDSFLSWLDRNSEPDPMFWPVPKVELLEGHSLLDLAVGNGDADGLAPDDVFALTSDGFETRLWRRMMQSNFDVVVSVPLPGDYVRVAVGSVDGRADRPLVVALDPESDALGIFDVQGSFLAVEEVDDPHALRLGDLDDDGYEDIVVARWDPSICPAYAEESDCDDGEIVVFAGHADLDEVQPVASATVGKAPQSLLLGDFDQSGHLDIASLNAVTGDITVVEGDDDGVYAYTRRLELGVSGGGHLDGGDFNGDGVDDLAVVHEGSETLRVFVSNP